MYPQTRAIWIGALAALSLFAVACGSTDLKPSPNGQAGATTDPPSAAVLVLEDAPSPVGGSVKRLVLPGPESSVLVVCDRHGFQPFLFTDQGEWIGCELIAGSEPGADSVLVEPVISDIGSPADGTVKEVTIPGPQTSILVACRADGLEPFLFHNQGTWVGCQAG